MKAPIYPEKFIQPALMGACRVVTSLKLGILQMTRKLALQILIENAAANAAGMGVGIKEKKWTSIKNKDLVRYAIIKLWKDAYDDVDLNLFNLGL